MRNFLKIFMVLAVMSLTFTSCRDDKDTKTVDGIEVDKDADVKVSDDGDKIKVEDANKKIKIKKNDDGSLKKKKVKNKD